MPEFKTIDDVDINDKVLLVRVDINVPYNTDTKTISDSERLREHAKTIQEVMERGAKVVILAHQGRKGDPDYISLKQHAELLSKHIGKTVTFIDDIIGSKAIDAIRRLKGGEALLLDNVRFLDDETQEKAGESHAKSKIVTVLSPLADLFVNDAFSASHRSHASIVGFTVTLPSIAGRVMEKEVQSCQRALNPARPSILILGGAKPDDCIEIMTHMLTKSSLDKVLTCGLLGELMLKAQGIQLGQQTESFLERKRFLELVPELKRIYDGYKEKIMVPVDIADEEEGRRVEKDVKELPCRGFIMDIGKETIKRYQETIRNAKTIVAKGPAGVYEKTGFETGTKRLFEEISKAQAYTMIGGGDTSVALEKLGFNVTSFSHVSIAGGALITYLSGESLPGVEALERAGSMLMGRAS